VRPALVVLAAGASARLGEPKALVELGGRTALARLLAAGAALDAEPPLVVTGADHEAIARAVREARLGCELAHNAAWAAGRTGGLALARARRAGRDLCIAPVDCPLVPPAVFAALARAWERAGAPARGWLAPRFDPPRGSLVSGAGRHGHPIVVGRGLARDLETLGPDAALSVLRERADPLLAVGGPWPEVLDDLDEPADLARLRARLGG
jgi:molybdenum cofactor cytidylyltransferase